MRTAFVSGLLLLLLAAACSSSGSSPGDAKDASTCAQTAAGTTVGTCTPSPCFGGNSKHVGAYCTEGGGQCSTYTSANVACSIDLSTMGSNFCILLNCMQDSDCGEDACCTGMQGTIKACVPKGCFDGGICQAISP